MLQIIFQWQNYKVKVIFVHLVLLLQLLLIDVVGTTKTGYVNNNDDHKDGRQQGKSLFGAKKDSACKSGFCSAKSKKYILYDVNRGEGFNLRRDIYVRIAPIVKALNNKGNHSQWILVLPPWGQLPHWTDSNLFNWKTFFNLDEIQKYVPAIDFEDYLDEYGLDNPVDAFYQLEHFPLDSRPSNLWSENVKVCDTPLKWSRDQTTGRFTGQFWKNKLIAKNASCLALKGQSSDFVNFFLDLSPTSILLDRAEVILWDHYGGKDWWSARLSLQFAQNLVDAAAKWVEINFPTFTYPNLNTANYLAVHLRRGDFVLYRKEPSLQDIAYQIVKTLSTLEISNVFIATDGTTEDMSTIKNHAATITEDSIIFTRFDCVVDSQRLTEGECAIVDQIISAWAKYFIGTADSTFTFRIFEEREILSIDPQFNYHVFCLGKQINCSKSTRWPVITEEQNREY